MIGKHILIVLTKKYTLNLKSTYVSNNSNFIFGNGTEKNKFDRNIIFEVLYITKTNLFDYYYNDV